MDLEQKSIERIKIASEMSLTYYQQPLIVTDSGGKDSAVCLELVKRSGVPFEVSHNHTTADAPQTVRFVRKNFHEMELKGIHAAINYPYYKGQRVSMWTLIPQRGMPPTRRARYCCEVLKEQGGKNRLITTGVRWDESTNRKNSRGIYEKTSKDKEKRIILNNDNDDRRKLFENCQMKAKRVCNPIIDWNTSNVWDFIHSEKIEVNPLYGCGFDRVGCIGCPMASDKRYEEFRMFPKYEILYRHAFERTVSLRKAKGLKEGSWKTGDGMFSWWMEDKNLDGQMSLFDDLEQ